MLSPKLLITVLLSLVLISIFYPVSLELRLAVANPLLWALGLVIHHRFHNSLPTSFFRVHAIFVFATFLLLSFFNDIFYYNVVGHFFDLFFARSIHDPNEAGSGFIELCDTMWRRYRYPIRFAFRFLWFATKTLVVFTTLPFAIALWHKVNKEFNTTEYERAFRFMEENDGQYPPWLVRKEVSMPEPKRDTRYCRLGDGDVIFVCGIGGGFQRVVNGDVEGAISRRRGISKEFT